MSHLFSSFTVRGLTLRNRIVMSPMAMHISGVDGRAGDWHIAHLGARAVGGVGLIMTEATAVQATARMSLHHLGLWDDSQVDPLARVVRLCKDQGAAMGIQLVHAGRKAWTDDKGAGPAVPVAPSAIPFDADWVVPRELTAAEIDCIVLDYGAAASRALAAGYEAIEIHGAHGYLLHQFLSPLTNKRNDAYGGSLENRARLLLRIVESIRRILPERQPLLVRLSCSDWAPGGLVVEDLITVARWLADRGVDIVDCSAGGLVPVVPPTGPGYQVQFAERIRLETGIPTIAVGLITSPELADEIVRNGRADLVALGRELLRDPYWPLHAAMALGHDIAWPKQYQRAKPKK